MENLSRYQHSRGGVLAYVTIACLIVGIPLLTYKAIDAVCTLPEPLSIEDTIYQVNDCIEAGLIPSEVYSAVSLDVIRVECRR